MHATLAVQTGSLPFVRNVALHIRRQLERGLGACDLAACDSLDDLAIEGPAAVFVIGEHFGRFARRPGVVYVYLNFSVVAVLGNPFGTNPSGRREARRKLDLVEAKCDLFDLLLDYYPQQTGRLARCLPIPVRGFPVAVDPADVARPDGDPLYDVCFVGTLNRRRAAVLDRISAMGWTVSPSEGVVFEEMAARSRCCLNVHKLRSNHLELPRIAGALAAGAPMVSEASHGLDLWAPGGVVTEAPLAALPETVDRLLRAGDALKAQSKRATAWYLDEYMPRSARTWQALCAEVLAISGAQTGRVPAPCRV